jgi:hypothetical protein
MTNSFSERHGITVQQSLSTKEITVGLRNRLWNTIKNYINDFTGQSRSNAIKYLWDRFFKQDDDNLKHNQYNGYILLEGIKDKFYLLEWNRVYDFIELLLEMSSYKKSQFINDINIIFVDERAPYKIIDYMVVPLISDEEAAEVEKVVASKYSSVSGHINKAIELYRKRPIADYQNSIKESISALEALVKIILNDPKGTLGALVGQLKIHPAFQEGIKKLYGWTSDEGGLRHADSGEGLKSDETEARYMLIQCSALINYIISKYE